MFNNPIRAAEALPAIIREAAKVLDLPEHELQFMSWPQSWPNTSCGFGGIAGQAFTTAQTTIVTGIDSRAVVFHAGRLAYIVKNPSQRFWELCGQRRLPGARGEDRRSLEREHEAKR